MNDTQSLKTGDLLLTTMALKSLQIHKRLTNSGIEQKLPMGGPLGLKFQCISVFLRANFKRFLVPLQSHFAFSQQGGMQDRPLPKPSRLQDSQNCNDMKLKRD